MMPPFHPIDRATATISASTTSARAAIPKQPSGRHQVRIFNGTAEQAYYRICGVTDDATSADIPLPSGAIEVVTVQNADADSAKSHVAVILAASTGSVFVTTGHGI